MNEGKFPVGKDNNLTTYNNTNLNNSLKNSNNNLNNSNCDGSFGHSKTNTNINPYNSNKIDSNLDFSNNNDINFSNLKNKNEIPEFYFNNINYSQINNPNNPASSRNDFSKDENILNFLFNVIDSNSTYCTFKKFNLNFFDLLNITRDELGDFKIPIKEKLRVIKLNSNLKKFLDENNQTNMIIYASANPNLIDVNFLLNFFIENKFLIYNHKFFENCMQKNSGNT